MSYSTVRDYVARRRREIAAEAGRGLDQGFVPKPTSRAVKQSSTFEGNGTPEAELRSCARLADSQIRPSVTINGVSVELASVETRLLNISLPDDNIFNIDPDDVSALTGQSVAHGYEYLSRPITGGSLTIVNNVTFADGKKQTITTVITVG